MAGAGVAQGYLNLPERTAQSFVADPFVRFHDASELRDQHERAHVLGSGRMYRTGDMGVYGDDMRLYFMGRADAQVYTQAHMHSSAHTHARTNTRKHIHFYRQVNSHKLNSLSLKNSLST